MVRVFAYFAAAFIFVSGAFAQSPITIGETFTLQSKAVGEQRRINVWLPPVYADSPTVKLPVLYMPDGGMAEDFLHVAGLLQVSIGNGTMRPFILVGIENTQRRRDLTGPTTVESDKKIARVVGGSAAFRAFIRDELKPYINAHYRTTNESAIVGESLAGLFIVETFFLEPKLFDTYIAFDPSLWWNNREIVDSASARLKRMDKTPRTLYISPSSEPSLLPLVQYFGRTLKADAPASLTWYLEPMLGETHATIYHPAALRAFRQLFKP